MLQYQIDWVRLNVPPTQYRSYGDGLQYQIPPFECGMHSDLASLSYLLSVVLVSSILYVAVLLSFWYPVVVWLVRLALSSWTCTATWFQCTTWNRWRRSRTRTWTSTCGTRRTRDVCFHRGSSRPTLSRLHCSRTSGARVSEIDAVTDC